MSVMSQYYLVIFDPGISIPGHYKEVFYGLNDINKGYVYQLMSNVQLLGSKTFDSHIIIYSSKQNNDVSMAKEFQKHLSKEHQENGVVYQVK